MRYRNLEVWKRSKNLTIEVYKELSQLKDFGFKDQITRSALSVPSNIADKIAGAYFECRSSRRQPERRTAWTL